jgi:hypothetical protein
MDIQFSRPKNAWYLEEKNAYFHIPFVRNASNAFLKRVFRQDFNLSLDDDIIQQLRRPKGDDVIIELKNHE